jgi:hypothetical protein
VSAATPLAEAAGLMRLAAVWDDPADAYEAPDLLREACSHLASAIATSAPWSRERRVAKAALVWTQTALTERVTDFAWRGWDEMLAHSKSLADVDARRG